MSKHRKSLRRLVIAVGVALAICGVVAAGTLYVFTQSAQSLTDWLSYEGGCLGSEPYSRQTIEQMGNFRIPNSARNLNATSLAWQDCVVYVDFEMDASELNDFLTSTYVSEPLTMTNILIGFNPDDYARWGLDRSRQYLYGGGGNLGSEWQYIAIDADDPENYKVYLISVLL